MASGKTEFIAIDVGQGDAFFLRRCGKTALVDGGRSKEGFPDQFRRVTGADRLDVLVCTHNDADHASGVLGLLRCGFPCQEVWLPGSWTYRLRDLLSDPSQFIHELVHDVSQRGAGKKVGRLDEIGDSLADDNIETPTIPEGAQGPLDALGSTVTSEQDDPMGLLWPYLWSAALWPVPLRSWPQPEMVHLLAESVSAVQRIKEIAALAYSQGARVRWFEFRKDAARRVGQPDFLELVNAAEVPEIPTRQLTALDWLALTTANKRSLVLISPSNRADCSPMILFTSDSDLRFQAPVNWEPGMIITAPHHGSEDNASAYERFNKDASEKETVIWVRSDGRFKCRPGPSYMGVSPRICTLCRGSSHHKQRVQLLGTHGQWNPAPGVRACQCT